MLTKAHIKKFLTISPLLIPLIISSSGNSLGVIHLCPPMLSEDILVCQHWPLFIFPHNPTLKTSSLSNTYCKNAAPTCRYNDFSVRGMQHRCPGASVHSLWNRLIQLAPFRRNSFCAHPRVCTCVFWNKLKGGGDGNRDGDGGGGCRKEGRKWAGSIADVFVLQGRWRVGAVL